MTTVAAARPFFSVIMPVHNHVRYVGPAIDSVIAQTFSDWELLVVDDGSTDGSAQAIDAAAARDRRILAIHQPNAGPGAARNNAIGRARGQWMAYLDSDDLYYPSALRDFADYIAAHPDARFIHGYRHRLNADGSVTHQPGEFQDRATGAIELFARMYLSHLCLTYRRELLEKVGPYDARLRTAQDYDLYLRMSFHTEFWPLNKATGLRRRHGTNISHQTGHVRTVTAMVLERFIHQLGGDKLVPADLVARRLGRVWYSAGRAYMRQRFFRQAAGALRRSLGYRRSPRALALLAIARAMSVSGRTDGRPLPQF